MKYNQLDELMSSYFGDQNSKYGEISHSERVNLKSQLQVTKYQGPQALDLIMRQRFSREYFLKHAIRHLKMADQILRAEGSDASCQAAISARVLIQSLDSDE